MSENSLIFKLIGKDNIKKVKDILKKDRKLLYTYGPNKENPIHYACFYGNKEIIQITLPLFIKLIIFLSFALAHNFHLQL